MVQDKRSVEFGLTLAAIPVTIVILFLAALFTRRENKVGMFSVIVSQSQFWVWKTANIPTDTLFWWPCLLPLQSRSNVSLFTEERSQLQTSSEIVDYLCRHNDYFNSAHDCQRLHLHSQLWPRVERGYRRPETGR